MSRKVSIWIYKLSYAHCLFVLIWGEYHQEFGVELQNTGISNTHTSTTTKTTATTKYTNEEIKSLCKGYPLLLYKKKNLQGAKQVQDTYACMRTTPQLPTSKLWNLCSADQHTYVFAVIPARHSHPHSPIILKMLY